MTIQFIDQLTIAGLATQRGAKPHEPCAERAH
jgi:hypothetical protein